MKFSFSSKFVLLFFSLSVTFYSLKGFEKLNFNRSQGLSEFTHNMNPTATISGNATVCQFDNQPQITFTGSDGQSPYTFTYTINGGSQQEVTTNGNNNSVNLNVNTTNAGTFTYELVSVEDDNGDSSNVSGSVVIQILPAPNASMGGTGSGTTFNGIPVFRSCSNSTFEFTFTNTSTTQSVNTNYTIDWGDGSSDFSGTTWTTLNHIYSVGLYNLIYTVESTNGCSREQEYIVFVGSNPAVGIGNPGNTDICNDESLTFPINNTENNPPGTVYIVTINDGTSLTFNHPPPDDITHTFDISSCGTNSSDGSNTFQDSFSINIIATNPCGDSSSTALPIYISTVPTANFSIPPTESACTTEIVCFDNTSIGDEVNPGSSCNTSPKIVWSISPNTYTLQSGSTLGDDFNLPDPATWLAGSNQLCVNFTAAGEYTITLNTGNRCGSDTIEKIICIEEPLDPIFTPSNNEGCIGDIFNFSNDTVESNLCSTPTYLWSVGYSPSNCGTTESWDFVNGTDNSSPNPDIEFNSAGTYSVTLTVTSEVCGSYEVTEIIEIKRPPIASIINLEDSYCGEVSIQPIANINTCAPSSDTITYTWSFPGGNPSTSSSADPGLITYSPGDNYQISLIVSNNCGEITTQSDFFDVIVIPEITNSVLEQTICSGTSTTEIVFQSSEPNTTYQWNVLSADTNIDGELSSNNTDNIPPHVLTSNDGLSGQVIYQVIPSIGDCVGVPINFTINVSPSPTTANTTLDQEICLGGPIDPLEFDLINATGTVEYQWYSGTTPIFSDANIITGETNATYQPPVTLGTFYYFCLITFEGDGSCSQINTQPFEVTVNENVSLTIDSGNNQLICEGADASELTVTTSGSGAGTINYLWYSSDDLNIDASDQQVGTGLSYNPGVLVASGTYHYYVIADVDESLGCSDVESEFFTIVVAADPQVTIAENQEVCEGVSLDPITATISGGIDSDSDGNIDDFTFQWYLDDVLVSTDLNTYNPGVLGPGTYEIYCVITQVNGLDCEATSNIVTIIVNEGASTTNTTSDQEICLGGPIDPLEFDLINSTGTVEYQWYSGTTPIFSEANIITGETNTTYQPPEALGTFYYFCLITFEGDGSCSQINTQPFEVTVNENVSLTIDSGNNQLICEGADASDLIITTSGSGAGTINYLWYSSDDLTVDNADQQVGTGLSYDPGVLVASGTYHYYVIADVDESLGCSDVESEFFTIVVAADPQVTIAENQEVCEGVSLDPITATIMGGIDSDSDGNIDDFTFQWYLDDVLVSTDLNTYTPGLLGPGTYEIYCVVTQVNGLDCEATSNIVTITVNEGANVSISPNTAQEICLDETLQDLSVSYSNGVGSPTYQWYVNDTPDTDTPSAIGSDSPNYNFVASDYLVGTFYYYCILTFDEGGCGEIQSPFVEITINQVPVISDYSLLICSGNNFEIIPDESDGDIVPINTTYTWSNPVVSPVGAISGVSQESTPQESISQDLVNNTTSQAIVEYTVTPTSGNCIGEDFFVTVTVNPSILAEPVATNISCFGENDGLINIGTIQGGIPFSSGDPYVVSWTGPGGFASNDLEITGLSPGIYELTILDDGGCPYEYSQEIFEPTELVVDNILFEDITCFGENDGYIQVDISGGSINNIQQPYFFNWTKDGLFFSDEEDISNLGPGVYQLTFGISDVCFLTLDPITIVEPELLTVALEFTPEVIECFGAATGTINIVVEGGREDYTFIWTGPNGFSSTEQNLEDLVAGDYEVIVMDSTQPIPCATEPLLITLTQNDLIEIPFQAVLITQIRCDGDDDGSIIIDPNEIIGGVPPYEIEWSDEGNGWVRTNLSPGIYTATIIDSLGCSEDFPLEIETPPIFRITPEVTQISCAGEDDASIILNLEGGVQPVTVIWDDDSTAGVERNNLPAGTYQVTINDSSLPLPSCEIIRSFTIDPVLPLEISAIVTPAWNCDEVNSGSINLSITGGTIADGSDYQIEWSNGSTSEDLNNVGPGFYSVYVEDDNGCWIEDTWEVTRFEPLELEIVPDVVFDCDTREVDITFVASASGGVPDYTYSWSSGSVSGPNNEFMTTDFEGAVQVTVTDNNECEQILTYEVEIPELGFPDFSVSSIGYSNYGIYSIQDPIQFTNEATGDYISIVWDFGDGNFSSEENPEHTYLQEGSYVVKQTVTYDYGCIYEHIITLEIEKGYALIFPNAFTPNEDGLNDYFVPKYIGLNEMKFNLYDTWGSLIFSEEGDDLIGWDGKLKGRYAENGNYYYTFTGKTFYGRLLTSEGAFTFIK